MIGSRNTAAVSESTTRASSLTSPYGTCVTSPGSGSDGARFGGGPGSASRQSSRSTTVLGARRYSSFRHHFRACALIGEQFTQHTVLDPAVDDVCAWHPALHGAQARLDLGHHAALQPRKQVRQRAR